MKNFSFVLLFAIMIAATLNSCVEKCSRDNQVIIEECFCVKDDKGNFVDLHYVKKKNGVVSITVEPSSIKLNEDSIPGCITFSNNVTIKNTEDGGTFCFKNDGEENLWIFEATLGEPNFCKSIYNDGDGSEGGQINTVKYKCICYGGDGSKNCKGISQEMYSAIIKTECVQNDLDRCMVSDKVQPCQIELVEENGISPLNPNSATLLIVSANILEYNGLKYK